MSSQGMGLLKRANLLNQKKGLAFFEFIQKYNIKRCAIFTKTNNDYYISQSIGFDGISICFSKSTVDFWNGIIPQSEKIYNFNSSQKTLSSVLQFFSLKLKDEIDFVDIYKSNDKILFVCNKEISQEMISSFNEIDINLDFSRTIINELDSIDSKIILNKYSIDFEEAVDSFISENTKNNTDIIKASISNELQNRLFRIFNKPHFYKKSGLTSAKVILSSKETVPEELFINHIIVSFKSVLDNNAALINITDKGKCQSYSQITDFLQD